MTDAATRSGPALRRTGRRKRGCNRGRDAGRPLLVVDSGQDVLSSDILGLKTNDP